MTEEGPRGGPVDPVVPEGYDVHGISSLVGPDGSLKGQWVKARKQSADRQKVVEKLLREMPKYISPVDDVTAVPFIRGGENTLAAYPLGDPHIGMYAWGKEAGEDFDLEKAERLFKGAVDELMGDGPPADEALIVNLGDYFHADNPLGVTSRSGHVLDVDTRWMRVYQVGIDIQIHMVRQALRHHRRVHMINTPGNHDDMSAMTMAVAISCFFSNDPRVHVTLSPAAYRYHRFGRNLFGITHGHNSKLEDLESIMATDRPQDWGETDHRTWFVGHFHHKRHLDLRGCTVEVFRTLAPKDAWSAAAGYRNRRDVCRISYDADYGEVSRQTVSASYLQQVCLGDRIPQAVTARERSEGFAVWREPGGVYKVRMAGRTWPLHVLVSERYPHLSTTAARKRMLRHCKSRGIEVSDIQADELDELLRR